MTTMVHQTVNYASPFSQPILAIAEGKLVKVTHVGDLEGSSSAFLCVDEQGQASWISQDQVRIIDPSYLPQTREQVENLLTRISSLSGTSSSR